MNTPLKSADVAIVGLGPAGATLANLLGQAGLSVLVFEREDDIYPLPRAIHFDGEVMRIFPSIGLKDEIDAIARPGLKGMHFVNAENKTLLVRVARRSKGPTAAPTTITFTSLYSSRRSERVWRDLTMSSSTRATRCWTSHKTLTSACSRFRFAKAKKTKKSKKSNNTKRAM